MTAQAKPEKAKTNTHSVAIHIGDGRKIAPGEAIPANVPAEVRKALEATGYFK